MVRGPLGGPAQGSVTQAGHKPGRPLSSFLSVLCCSLGEHTTVGPRQQGWLSHFTSCCSWKMMLVLHAVLLKKRSHQQQMWPGRAAESASCQHGFAGSILAEASIPLCLTCRVPLPPA